MSYGANTKFGIARQASAGTAVTAPTSYHAFAFVSHDIGLEKDEVISENLTGRFEQGATYDGVARILGTVEFEVTPRNMLAALAAVVNHSPASVTSASLRTYTFVPNTVDFDAAFVKAPWSIYSQFADASSGEQFYDCQFGQLEFSISQGQFIRGRATVNGGTRTATGINSLDIVAGVADSALPFPWNVCSISWGGAGMPQNTDLTITLNENIEALYTNNATLAPFKYARSGFREVTVGGTLYYTSRDLLNDFVAGTQRALRVTMMNTRTAIQSGYFNQLVIDIPQCKLTAMKPSVSGPGEVQVSFSGRGVADPSSGYSILFTAISTWAPGF